MWIRAAFWEGRTKAGLEDRFRRLIDEEILIGLRRLPGVQNARALWPHAFEGRPADIICQIMVEFEDESAMRAMLASPERTKLHGRLPELLGLIDGTISHVNFEIA
jgi:hypothetical protein